MNADELKEKIQKLTIWKNGYQRAPHKPLLILYALGQLQAGGSKLLSYQDVRNICHGDGSIDIKAWEATNLNVVIGLPSP